MAGKHKYLVNLGAWVGVWTRALLCAWVQEGCQDAGTVKLEGELHWLVHGHGSRDKLLEMFGEWMYFECSSWLKLVGWIFFVHLGFLAHEMNKKHTVLVMLASCVKYIASPFYFLSVFRIWQPSIWVLHNSPSGLGSFKFSRLMNKCWRYRTRCFLWV